MACFGAVAGGLDLTSWLRQQCADYAFGAGGVFLRDSDRATWPLVAHDPAELEARLGSGGHLLPLPKEPCPDAEKRWAHAAMPARLTVMLLDFARLAWTMLRALLPYPDLPRRVWMRHRAFRLVTIRRWPADDAVTSADAAQLALLRALYLQRLARREVRWRHREEAALIARSAIDNLLVGLYCVYNADAVKQLTGGEHLAIRRVTAYLTRDDLLFSKEAVLSAADAVGERGRDLNLKDVAEWLNREKGLLIAVHLYEGYYSALSHFFPHSSGFALMRHVDAGGKLRRRPAFPWVRRSAVRITDGCVGLLAAHVAKETSAPATAFFDYAVGHLTRALTPTYVATSKRWLHAIGWRRLPGMFMMISAFGRYVRGSGSQASPAEREAHVRKQFADLLSAVSPDVPDAAFQPVINELVSKVLAGMSSPIGDSPGVENQPD